MDFARSQLEKYGWKQGEGLGKNKDGQAAPIRTQLKLNSYGVGFNAGKEYSNNWWERVFNEAASNIQAVKDEEGVVTAVETHGQVNISTKRKRKEGEKLTYGTFKKKSCLNGTTEEPDSAASISDSSSDEEVEGIVGDEKLFQICGGRTGHKGSRHGLTLSGKLARLEQQEKMLSCVPPTGTISRPSAKPSAVVAEEPGKTKKKKKKDKREKKRKIERNRSECEQGHWVDIGEDQKQ